VIRFRGLTDRVPLVLLTALFLSSLIAGAGAQEVEPDP
jgi:hypothetical protein